MEPESSWNRVEQIFDEALEKPAGERTQWVKERCAQEPAVCAEVLALLRARDQAGAFLQSPLLDFSGQAFGPYTAVEEIGRGGMSVVYRGERTDGDFEKQVAIKVILVQTSEDVRRGETQILAGLEHPNIARLLDAGSTPLGFRYLLMEYVEGKPLTLYCEGRSERERLRLFLSVCEAVHFAHRALVVHRDLKPDNILVTADNRVKLLDFGIAKILDPLANGDQTQGVRAFSPNYASPEQLLGQPVTTSTDVYSLGVILCELLGGSPPRLLAGLTMEQMVDAARTAVKGIPLQGELAAIAAKALRTNPSERYESAGALARDVERYLRGLPIEAREPTWAYRARKFIARHRYSVAAATLGVLSLVAALSVALWQAREADRRFSEVRELARAMMFDVHDEIQFLPGSLEARKAIVDRSVRYLDALAIDPWASADVRLDLAQGYLRLSEIEGKDFSGSSLGRSKEALEHALRAVEIARPLAGSGTRSVAAAVTLVDALNFASSAYFTRGDIPQSVALGEEAVSLAEELVHGNPRDAEQKERLAATLKQLAAAYSKTNEREKARPLFERVLQIREELWREMPEHDMRQRRLAESHQWLCNEYWLSKDYKNAEIHAREAFRIHEARFRARPRSAHVNLAASTLMLAMILLKEKRYEEAVPLMQRTLALRRETAAEDPRNHVAALRVSAVLNRLGLTYREWGRIKEAVQYGEAALAETRKVWEADRKNAYATTELFYARSDLALTYERAGRQENACRMARESIQIGSEVPDKRVVGDVRKKLDPLWEQCPK